MLFLRSYLVYTSLLLVLLGLCSSFQRPTRSTFAQARWEWAQAHQANDTLLYYQAQLQEEWTTTGKTAIAQDQNRQFLGYVLNNELFSKGQKKELLEQYTSTTAWNYAYRVQWHSQYGQQDSAYFYKSLLESLPAGESALIYTYGQLAVNLGLQPKNYREANSYLRQAERTTKNAQDSLLLYPIQLQVYAALGQVDKARTAGLALIQRQRQEKKIDSIALATTFGQLGQLYQTQENYQQAIVYTGEAINYLADRQGHALWIGRLWYQLATTYYQMGNKPLETILYARTALSKWQEEPTIATKNVPYIDAYQLLAQQFLAVEQLDSSQTYLDKTSRLQKDFFYKIAERQTVQAALYQRQGKATAANVALQKALEATLLKEGNKGEVVAARWLALGQQYQQQKQWTAARQALTEAFWALSWQPRRRVLPPSSSLFSKRMALLISNAQMKTFLALEEQSKYAVSQEVVQQQLDYTIALLQEMQPLQPWEPALWEQAKLARQQVVEWQWRRFTKNSNAALLEIAFVQAEANRQAVIWEQLQRGWAQNSTRPLVRLQQQLQQEQAQQQWYQERIWLAQEEGDSSQMDWYRQQLAANNASWMLTRQQLEKQYKKHYQWYYQGEKTNLDSLQVLLTEGDALIEYLEAEGTVYQFIITKDTLVLRRIVWEDYQLTVLKYRKHFTNPKMQQYLSSGSFQDFCRTGHSLYYRLVHHELLKQVQRLIIVPDGLLQQLPFETLLTEIPLDSVHKADFSNLDYLLQSKRIHYQYSSQLWRQSWQDKAPVPNNELLAMSATYSVNKEANRTAVQQQLRAQLALQPYLEILLDSLSENYAGDFYNNRYASEYYYKEYAAKYGLLYLGFYGYNGAATKGLPSLIMAEDGYEEEDNYLSFYEIQEQSIQADVVFLGNVYQSRPEDLLALGASFLYAGSKNVVLPLWEQDSSAITVVGYYYEGLQQGLDNDDALRQAKLRYLKGALGTSNHPSYWAGYVLMGNQQVIKVSAPITYIWWFVLPIAFIGFLGWWSLQALRQKR